MAYSKKDKADVRSASQDDLAAIDGISEQVKNWNISSLRKPDDPNVFTFFAFF